MLFCKNFLKAYLFLFLKIIRKNLLSFLIIFIVFNFIPYFTLAESFISDKNLACAICNLSANFMLNFYFVFNFFKNDKTSGRNLIFVSIYGNFSQLIFSMLSTVMIFTFIPQIFSIILLKALNILNELKILLFFSAISSALCEFLLSSLLLYLCKEEKQAIFLYSILNTIFLIFWFFALKSLLLIFLSQTAISFICISLFKIFSSRIKENLV